MEKWISMDEKTPEYNKNVLFQAKSDGHMYEDIIRNMEQGV